VKLLLESARDFLKFPKATAWLQPTAGGLLVGPDRMVFAGGVGVGYQYVDIVLVGDFVLKTVVLLAILKLIATAACLRIRKRRRHFRPELVHWRNARRVGWERRALPVPAHYRESGGAYALVGMGALFAGIVRHPAHFVIMIFEMTATIRSSCL